MRLIDADELREEILNDDDYIFDNDTVNHFLDLVDLSPTIDAEPVVHGHWKVITFKNSRKKFIECSECGATIDCLATYIDENEYDGCPYCRAKMDEEQGCEI